MKPFRPGTLLVLVTLAILAGCTREYDAGQAKACSNGIDAAYRELQYAETQGLSSTVEWTKAASLLSAARVQLEFDRYRNCLDKVKRARAMIRRAEGG